MKRMTALNAALWVLPALTSVQAADKPNSLVIFVRSTPSE
jgi:hypothetical protein